MKQIEEDIVRVEAAIERVAQEIEQVAQEIVQVGKRLDAGGLSKEDVAYWRKEKEQLRTEEEQLRKEKEQLRKEKEQLRKEKEQLRETELFLLKQQQQQGENRGDQQIETPGSKSNPSRAALQKLFEDIIKSGFEVTWCGGVPTSPRDIDVESSVLIDDFSKLLARNLGNSIEKVSSEYNELENLDFQRLRNEGEAKFQKGHFQSHFFEVEGARALDSSSSSIDGPFFKPATTVGDHTVSAKTAKPDGTSVVMPMDIEIKSDATDSNSLAKVDYEVLQQAVERITMRMRNQGYLKMAFAFAVTGRSAWYLIVKRSEILKSPELWVDRVHHCDVGKLWMHLTKLSERDPGFFFSEDGAEVCAAIHKIGATPYCCRVKPLAKSQSVVYGITVPRKYMQSDGTPVIGVAVQPRDITYAIKIIRDDTIYTTESIALQKIAQMARQRDGLNSDFYALGCIPNGAGDAVRFETIREWETGHRFPMTGRFWWDRLPETKEGTGGAIIMRSGEATARREFRADHALPKRVCTELVQSLELAHSAGILQCDLRRSNFVRFQGSWQVIDYSLSVAVNSNTPYEMEPGAQADCAGYSIQKKYKGQVEIRWTEKDDYQMLIENILGSETM